MLLSDNYNILGILHYSKIIYNTSDQGLDLRLCSVLFIFHFKVFRWRENTFEISIMTSPKEHTQIHQTIDCLAEVRTFYYPNPQVPSCNITSSDDVDTLLRQIYPVDINHREAMIGLYLNRRNRTIGYSITSIGGIFATVCDPKIVFQTALKCNSAGIIVVHNHPAGDPNPSHVDICLTEKLVEIGKLLDLPVLDHIILAKDSHFSFAKSGLI